MTKREREYHKRKGALKTYLSKAHANDAIAAMIKQVIAMFPAPKYKRGTHYPPSGPEMVGENGKEIIFSRSEK